MAYEYRTKSSHFDFDEVKSNQMVIQLLVHILLSYAKVNLVLSHSLEIEMDRSLLHGGPSTDPVSDGSQKKQSKSPFH